MSAILGRLRRDGQPVTTEELAPAMTVMAPYGPDHRAARSLGPIAMGHLASHGDPAEQPLTCNGRTITADLRIDNRKELFAELAIPQSEQAGITDALLVLRAFQKWGADCPLHLIGDYAFAIWDPGSRSLFCARDHVGARPFYYCLHAGAFAFATDLRGLQALPGVPTIIDEAEIARRLMSPLGQYYDPAHTDFQHLRKLPFGHRLTLTDGQLHIDRYWRPETLPEIQLPSLDAYAERLRTLVQQAVAARMRSPLPVGAHLSGGLDSSTVAILAARLLRQQGRPPPQVYSWAPPPAGRREETEHDRMEAICQQEGLTPQFLEHTTASSPYSVATDTATKPRLTMLHESLIQPKAAAQGVKVMLSGWGGDEGISFNGRGLASSYLQNGQWRTFARYLSSHMQKKSPRRLLKLLQLGWSALVPCLPIPAQALWDRCRGRSMGRGAYINPEFAARIQPLVRPLKPPLRILTGVRANQWKLYAHGHLTARIESWAVHGADHGLTYAYPLLDRRVMEFAYGLPGELFAQQGRVRFVYRHAMAGILPARVPWRTVKDERAMHRSKSQNRLTPPEVDALLAQVWTEPTHPWVNLPKLRRDLLLSPRPKIRLAIQQALDCLTISKHWPHLID